jgi:hypothetical protein
MPTSTTASRAAASHRPRCACSGAAGSPWPRAAWARRMPWRRGGVVVRCRSGRVEESRRRREVGARVVCARRISVDHHLPRVLVGPRLPQAEACPSFLSSSLHPPAARRSHARWTASTSASLARYSSPFPSLSRCSSDGPEVLRTQEDPERPATPLAAPNPTPTDTLRASSRDRRGHLTPHHSLGCTAPTPSQPPSCRPYSSTAPPA